MPVLLYTVDACLVNRTLVGSIEFPLTRIMMMIWKPTQKKL